MERPQRSVADVVGETIAAQGVTDAFGVLGSGNLVVTNAMCANGVRFHGARHENGAIGMADGYGRVSGRLAVCSVHQGPGLTNTMTGLAEAAKSRTPVLVLAGETPAAALTSNFRIDQHGLVESVGAIADRLHSPATAPQDALRAYRRAIVERRPVVLNLPIDMQARAPEGVGALAPERPAADMGEAPGQANATEPTQAAIDALADLIQRANRPAIIAGRGAVLAGARDEIEELAALTGAVLATSAPANGLFHALPYALGISGGFATPLAQKLLREADLILVIGASANQWTTRHGALIAPTAKFAQIDIEARAIGRNRPADIAAIGDAKATAAKLTATLKQRGHENEGFRTAELAERIAQSRWPLNPYEDGGTDEYIDPRTLSIALNERLPLDKAVAIDSGAFMGYPAMFLDVPDARAWVFANGFQAVGQGLGTAIGAAVARPDRPTVAALGDGGTFMALAELETAARLRLKLLVLIYDDAAYGAEVHHFEPIGHDVSMVRFPDADLAGLGRAAGAGAHTVRTTEDLQHVDEWLNETTPRPLVLDAKVNPTICAEWLAEAFRGG